MHVIDSLCTKGDTPISIVRLNYDLTNLQQ